MLRHKTHRAASTSSGRRRPAGSLPDEPANEFVTEAGLSVEPENLGRQFLKDATGQGNFESLGERDWVDPQAIGLGHVVSQASLEAAGQEDEDADVPDTEATWTSTWTPPTEEVDLEPSSEDVDLLSDTIRGGSLFDEPIERGGVRVPVVHTDESEVLSLAARERAKHDELEALFRYRPKLNSRRH